MIKCLEDLGMIRCLGPGDDSISGEDGNDNLFGGSGDDNLAGGKGKDYFNCGLGKDNVSDLNATEGDGKSYNCEGQEDIKVQSNINTSEQSNINTSEQSNINTSEQSVIITPEQCSVRLQSLIEEAQVAIDSGEYGQWRSQVASEIQLLNKDCPEQMQGWLP
jgi:RTX calcium-binding nonapeptide repeat (4 copies)